MKDKILKNPNSAIVFLREEKIRIENLILKIRNFFHSFFLIQKQKRINGKNIIKVVVFLLATFFLLQASCESLNRKSSFLSVASTSRYATGETQGHDSGQASLSALSKVTADGVIDHLMLTGSSAQTAGVSQTVTIMAVDSLGNVYSAYTGHKTITFSGANSIGSYSPACTDKNGTAVPFGTGTVLSFSNGVATCSLKLYKAEKASVAFTDGSYSGSFQIDVSSQTLNGFNVSAPATVYRNVPFYMAITARDPYGNPANDGGNATSLSTSRGAITPASILGGSFYYGLGPDGLSYAHRRSISITNNTSENLTSYQVKLTFDTASLISNSKMQADCDDLRFAETNGANIPYWLEGDCNTSSTTIWIKTNLNASATKSIYAYYGNTSVGSESNGNNVFEFLDEFNGTALDTAKWSTGYYVEENNGPFASRNTGYNTPHVSGGNLIFNGSRSSTDSAYEAGVLSGWWGRSVTSVNGIAKQNFIIESRMKFSQSSSGKYANQYGSHILGVGANANELVYGKYTYDNTISIGREVYGTKTVNESTSYAYNGSVWKKAKFTFVNSGVVYYQVGDSDATEYSVGENITTRKISMAFYHRAPGASVVQSVDWILVRQYATAEPAVAVESEISTDGVYTGKFTIETDTAGNNTITVTNGSVSATATVYVDIMDHFAVTGSSAQAAGTSQVITISAIGKSGNVYAAYTGSKAITFSGANSVGSYSPSCTNKYGLTVPFGGGTVLTFTNGQATCDLVLYKNETADINASDGSYTAAGHVLSVSVVSDINTFSANAPATATAGVAFSVVITAKDAYGGIATTFTGDKTITFSSTNASGIYYPSCTDKFGIYVPFGTGTVLSFSNGVAATEMKLYKAEGTVVAFTDVGRSASFRINIISEALDHFNISAPASAKSSMPFTMAVTPYDYYGNNVIIAGNTSLSVNHGTISNTYIPDSYFKIYAGPDGKNYGFRRDIAITNNVSESLTSYQVKVTLDTAFLISAGRMQADCDDLRFAELDGTNIPYWIEGDCNTSSTTVWIKTNLDASSAKNIYVYYGNETAGSESNPSEIFIFYDDFENGLGKWSDFSGAIYDDNGDNVLRLLGARKDYAYTAAIPDYQNIIVESKIRFSDFGAWGPRLTQDIYPIQTIIEANPEGMGGSWHWTWLGTSYDQKIDVATPSWTANTDYFSKLISTDSLQSWEIGSTVLSGTYARAATISGSKLEYWTWDAGNDVRIYWIKIRKYAAAEPTVVVGEGSEGGGTYRGELAISDILQDTNVTITVQNGSVANTVDVLIEAPSHMDHFGIEGANSQMAGSSQIATITALDESGGVYALYEGDRSIVFSGAGSIGDYIPSCNDISFGIPVILTFTNGVATCDLKLYKAESAVLSASDGTYSSTGGSLSVEVSPSVLAGFDLAAPAAAVSESAFLLSIGLRDVYGNIVNAITNDISLAVDHGTITPGAVAAGEFAASGTYAGNFTINQIYADTDVVITFSGGSVVQSKNITVEGVDHMGSLLLSAGNQAAGDTQDISITAIGLSGNVYALYTGDKTVIFSGASAVSTYAPAVNDIPFGTATTLNFVGGSATAAMKLYRAGNFSVVVSEDAYSGSKNITVTPASLSSFDLTTPAVVTCNAPFTATLTAMDAYGNVSDDVSADVGIGVSAGSVSPSYISYENFNGDGAYSGNFIVSAVYTDTDVAITFQSGSTIKTQTMTVIGVDRMNHFRVTGSASQVAGEVQTITVAAILDSGNIDTSYAGDKVVTFSGASAINGYAPAVNDIPFGTATTLNFVGGSATAAMKLHKAGGALIGVSDGSYDADSYALDVAVLPSALNSFAASAPASVISNVAFPMTVSAVDVYGNVTTQVSEDVSVAVDRGVIAPAFVSAVSFAANGSYTGNFTISDIFENANVTLTFQSGSITSVQSMTVTGVDKLHHFRLEGSGTQTAGETQTIIITAVTVSGRVDVDYEGSHDLIFSGASVISGHAPAVNGNVFGASTPIIFTGGTATCSLVLYKAETININVSDGAYSADGYTLAITIAAATAAGFDITVPDSAVSGTVFLMALTGKDTYTNIADSVAEDISLTVDQGTITPAIIAKTGFQGSGVYSGSFTISGITVPATVALTFTSGAIEATKSIAVSQENKIDHFLLSAFSSQIAGASQNVTIAAIDLSGSTCTDYAGEKILTFSGAGSAGDYYPTIDGMLLSTPVKLNFVAGIANFNLRLYKAETVMLTVTDGTYNAQASEIIVHSASLSRFNVVVPATVISDTLFSLTLSAFDAYGNAVADVPGDTLLSVSSGTISPVSVLASEFIDDGVYIGDIAIAHVAEDTAVSLAVQNGGIVQTADIEVIGNADVLDHFIVTANGQNAVSQIAGKPLSIAVTAVGASGKVYVAYNGRHSLTFSGAAAIGTYVPSSTNEGGVEIPFGALTTLSFVNGVAVSDIRLYKAGAADIAVTDNAHASAGYNLEASISADNVYSFAGSVPTVVASGMPFVISLTANDRYGNIANPTEDIFLSVDSGTVTSHIPAADFQGGSYIGEIAISDIPADTNVTLTFTSGSVVRTASLLATGMDFVDHLQLSSPKSEVFAGVPAQVDISIVKADGSIYTDYTGIKSITFSGAESLSSYVPYFTDWKNVRIPFASGGILSFTNGVASTQITLFRAGETTLQTSDGFYGTRANPSYALVSHVLSGTAADLSVDVPSIAEAGASFSLKLAARDEFGNMTSKIEEDISLSVSPGVIDTPSIPAAGFSIDGNHTSNVAVFGIAEDTDVVLTLSGGSISRSVHILIAAEKEISGSSGSSFILPQKANIGNTRVIFSGGRLSLSNAPSSATQISVSDSAVFAGSSWENIAMAETLLNRYLNSPKIYVKFRGEKGGISDVISYINQTASAAADAALNDGDIVKTEDNFDVYIIKSINGKQFRRLILSPHVFNSYQHLKWENIKIVSTFRMDSFVISALAQAAGDPDVYELFPAGDKGERKKIGNSYPYDPDSIYEINTADRDSYTLAK